MSVACRWPRLMRLAAGVLAALLAAGPPLAGRAGAPGRVEPGHAGTKLRIYDLSDLSGPHPLPAGGACHPPGWSLGSGGSYGTLGNAIFDGSPDWQWLHREGIGSESLRKLLAAVLAAERSPGPLPGVDVSYIRRHQDLLIVRATPAQHRRIEGLLARVRTAHWARPTYVVRAWWVMLSGAQARALLPGESPGSRDRPLTRGDLARLAPHAICRAEGLALAGQVMELLSGRGRMWVTDCPSLCSEYPALRPEHAWRLYGGALEVRVEPYSAGADVLVSLRTSASRLLGNRPSPATRRAAAEAGIDMSDLDFPEELRSAWGASLTVTPGRPVLAGGMTRRPAEGSQPDQAVYLILEVSRAARPIGRAPQAGRTR